MNDSKTQKCLIIVDMQNDFITGSLANKDAEDIIPDICKLIDVFTNKGKNLVYLTRDTHDERYLESSEGQKLPVEHCLRNTAGWCVHDDILKALREAQKKNNYRVPIYGYIDKYNFGFPSWDHYISDGSDIYVIGTCTDICVLSNVLLLQNVLPNSNIHVIKNLCAGTTPEKHKAALKVMESCLIDIIEIKDDNYAEII